MELDLQNDSENKHLKLHAMGFGELLDTTFSLYRKHFWSFFGVSAGYCPAMLIMISVFLLDDSVARVRKYQSGSPRLAFSWVSLSLW